MDVKYSFLNDILEEEVYVDQPLGYTVKGHEGKVFKLKKALYGGECKLMRVTFGMLYVIEN